MYKCLKKMMINNRIRRIKSITLSEDNDMIIQYIEKFSHNQLESTAAELSNMDEITSKEYNELVEYLKEMDKLGVSFSALLDPTKRVVVELGDNGNYVRYQLSANPKLAQEAVKNALSKLYKMKVEANALGDKLSTHIEESQSLESTQVAAKSNTLITCDNCMSTFSMSYPEPRISSPRFCSICGSLIMQ